MTVREFCDMANDWFRDTGERFETAALKVETEQKPLGAALAEVQQLSAAGYIGYIETSSAVYALTGSGWQAQATDGALAEAWLAKGEHSVLFVRSGDSAEIRHYRFSAGDTHICRHIEQLGNHLSPGRLRFALVYEEVADGSGIVAFRRAHQVFRGFGG
jgi:hypothetical protein